MITDDMRLRAMRERVDALTEENAWLKRELSIIQDAGKIQRVQSVFNMTNLEGRFLLALHHRRGGTLTKDAAMNALYSDRPNDEPQRKILDVFACKMRRKMREANGGANAIGTTWGVGYFLTAEGVAAVDGALALEFAEPRTTARHGRQEIAA